MNSTSTTDTHHPSPPHFLSVNLQKKMATSARKTTKKLKENFTKNDGADEVNRLTLLILLTSHRRPCLDALAEVLGLTQKHDACWFMLNTLLKHTIIWDMTIYYDLH
ncbi:hypothetical protein GOODEAATRI_021167 [Goodea atripinnis]|uniref:Uncharacterized protein n=1 Tax=Goodea atripinnis TaxID=208336 RepID=A0ABV0MJI5_9TELE